MTYNYKTFGMKVNVIGLRPRPGGWNDQFKIQELTPKEVEVVPDGRDGISEVNLKFDEPWPRLTNAKENVEKVMMSVIGEDGKASEWVELDWSGITFSGGKVEVVMHRNNLPRFFRTEPTPPQRQIESAVNAGGLLALQQWIDWLSEQSEPPFGLIRGLTELLKYKRFPATCLRVLANGGRGTTSSGGSTQLPNPPPTKTQRISSHR